MRILTILLFLAGVMVSTGLDAATTRVSDADSLLAALRSAQGGDVIVLADGEYGDVRMKGAYKDANIGRFDSPVTVTAENPGRARFATLRVSNAVNLAFDGLTVDAGLGIGISRNIAITNSTASHLFLRDVDGARIAGNRVSGGGTTLGMISVANFTIVDNIFEKATLDIMQIGRNTRFGRIENNFLLDPQAAKPGVHPDLMQFFGWGGMNPHDIVIRGNVLYDDLSTGLVGAQGIFMSDAHGQGYRNILIEQNLLGVRHPNAIYISGGQENVVIRNNSLIAAPTGGYKGGTIRLARRSDWTNEGVRVEGNITAGIVDETKRSSIGRNLIYPNSSGIFVGPGGRWQDFLLRNPQRFPGMGASERLEELQSGIR